MMGNILRLYPPPCEEIALEGAYLGHNVRRFAEESGKPFVYANFITSLDGRIAMPHPSGRGFMVPKATANERDWRLFQELAAQADIILSSGRYLREWAAGRAQEILQVDDPRFADLREWRRKRGLPAQPDLAILSASLKFPLPPVLTAGGRKVVFFTTEDPDPRRVAEIEAQAGPVVIAGETSIDGEPLLQRLDELGYRTIYSAAGPRILHLLAEAGKLNRLYMTYANRMLGGEPYATLLEGPSLEPAASFKMHHIYLDPHALDGLGQLFVSYDRA